MVFRGKVQGVGFRMTANHIASRHPGVAGFVRNEPDGTVFLALEGERERIERYLADVRGAMSNFIASESVMEAQPAGLLGFEVRR